MYRSMIGAQRWKKDRISDFEVAKILNIVVPRLQIVIERLRLFRRIVIAGYSSVLIALVEAEPSSTSWLKAVESDLLWYARAARMEDALTWSFSQWAAYLRKGVNLFMKTLQLVAIE